MARSKKRLYAVCIQKKDGALITEVTEAATAGEAIDNIIHQHHAGTDPDCEWILVRSEAASEELKKKPRRAQKKKKASETVSDAPLTDQQKERARHAVASTLALDFDPSLRDTSILDAYALGIAEGP